MIYKGDGFPAFFKTWHFTDIWRLQEGICLLVGVEPNSDEMNKMYSEHSKSQLLADYYEILRTAERSLAAGSLVAHVRYPNILYCEFLPPIFLLWARSKEINIPAPLVTLIDESLFVQNTDDLREDGVTLRTSQLAKKVCQGIARTIWDDHPQMTIEEMKKHHAILEYGGGKHYPGRNTLRDWLREVDPRPPEKKTGCQSSK